MPRTGRTPAEQGGYTLVEVTVVVLVIGILSAVAIPSFVGARRSSQDRVAATAVKSVQIAATRFFTESGSYAGATAAALQARTTGTLVVGPLTPSTDAQIVSIAVSATRVWAVGLGSSGKCFWATAGPDARALTGVTLLPSCSASAMQAAGELDVAGLVGFWRLGEPSGATAYDSSGSGLHGTYVGNRTTGEVGAVTGDPDLSVTFPGGANGTGASVSLPDLDPDLSAGITISAWVRPAGSAQYGEQVIDLGRGTNLDNIVLGRYQDTGRFAFTVVQEGAGTPVTSPDGALVSDQWQHLAATLDGSGNVVLYRNGVAVATATGYSTSPQNVARTSSFIGRSNTSADTDWRGGLDEVAIYNRALTAAQVATLANPVVPDALPVTSGLRLWLDGDDLDGDGSARGAQETGQSSGAVQRWTDKSGNGCDATRPAASTQAPQLVAGSANGRETVRFSLAGGPNMLSVTCSSIGPLGSADRNMIAVARANTTGGGTTEYGGAVAVFPGWHAGLSITSNPGTTAPVALEACQFTNGGSGQACPWAGTYTAGRLAVLSATMTVSGGGVTSRAYVDGGTAVEATATGSPWQDSGTLRIGRAGVFASHNYQLDGDVAELIVFDRVLDDAERQEVEAYLTAKWLTAPTSTAPANLQAWFDASDLDGDGAVRGALEGGLSGSSVASWVDRSGRGRTATASSSARPTFVLGALNGLPVVRFDAVDDVVQSAPGTSVAGGPSTIVAVLRTQTKNPASATANPVSLGWSSGCAGITALGNPLQYALDSCGANQAASSGSSSSWRVVSVRYAGASIGGAQLYQDGVLQGTGSGANAVNAWTQLRLGARDITGSAYWGGDIAEVRVYDKALSDVERQSVESELRSKWGLP